MFLAPEVIKDETNLESGCDVYSFGAILYFLVTGGISDDDLTPIQNLEFKEEIWTKVSKNLHEFVKSCVEHDVKKRTLISHLRKNAFM